MLPLDLSIYKLQMQWQLRFMWLPKRCDITDKLLWFKYAYHGVRLITGPGDAVELDYYHSKPEHLIWIMKNA